MADGRLMIKQMSIIGRHPIVNITDTQRKELAGVEPGTSRFRAVFTMLNEQPAIKKLMRELADK